MEMLLTILMAPQAGAGQKSNPMMSLLPFLLIIVVIYFFMIRPQSKKAKTQKLFKDTIKRGDKVVTIGGIVGRITEIREKEFEIEISRAKNCFTAGTRSGLCRDRMVTFRALPCHPM